MRSTPPDRAGFSLLEVILAVTILMGSAVVLAELAGIGRQHYTDAEDLAAAQLICESKLQEILAGAAAPEIVEDRPVPDVPGWLYSVEIEPADAVARRLGLATLRVTVSREPLEQRGMEQPTGVRRGPRCALSRWIPDPAPGGEADASLALPSGNPVGPVFGGSEF
ncbi:MAG: prepilin-type N-terminal cleavage/methylation domain-containing protein [Pirellulales bacterium]|nr:prepilin-type N-terminal cleavage/methylation domain-containing protein [Pirellulales bacterium]